MRTKQQIKEYNSSYYLKNKKKLIKQIRKNFNKKSLKEKREIYQRGNEYHKIWFNNKYHNDPIFRQRHIDRVKINNKRGRGK
jgi:hypothetical protein